MESKITVTPSEDDSKTVSKRTINPFEKEFTLKRRLAEKLYTVLYQPEKKKFSGDVGGDEYVGNEDDTTESSLMKPVQRVYRAEKLTCRYNYNKTELFFNGWHDLSPTKWSGFYAKFYDHDVPVSERKKYCSVKHSYDHLKCLVAEDDVIATAVSIAKTPSVVSQHMLRLHLVNPKAFPNDVKSQNMLVSARLRFFMNVKARHILRATYPLKLVYVDGWFETAHLFSLGPGLHLDGDDILDRANWLGKNEYGEILMKVRDELIEESPLKQRELDAIEATIAHQAMLTANADTDNLTSIVANVETASEAVEDDDE